ncbi:hypothetical protein EVA_14579 [gut metagenome]|uniref:Uncharacterized protein n=1 Tax=gut metagenome TaxID=749906 RepID=J9CBI8_9ZZZZ
MCSANIVVPTGTGNCWMQVCLQLKWTRYWTDLRTSVL